jgi:transcription initiation factor TFIIB
VAVKHGMKKMGKDPKGLAAAALYLSSKHHGERKTQTEIANTARITEVTLRTRAKQIKMYIPSAQ